MQPHERFWARLFTLILVAGGFLLGKERCLAVAANDRVQLAGGVIVRTTPGGNPAGTQATGAQGGVVAGPVLASLSGSPYIWWKVDFDSGADGWVPENNLTVILPPSPSLVSPGTPGSPGPVIYALTTNVTWNPVNGASNYGISVIDRTLNTTVLYQEVAAPASSLNLPAGILVYGHSYYWYATAGDSLGFSGSSTYYYFQVQMPPPPAPALVSPGSATGPGPVLPTLTPQLAWQPAATATGYGVYVYDGTAQAYVVVEDAVGNVTNYTIPSGKLISGHGYRWQARASNATGFSPYSTGLFFQAQPAQPTLNFTRQGANLVLQWPTNVTGFSLECTTSGPPVTAWSPVAVTPVIIGGNFAVTNPITGSVALFRLKAF